MKPQTQKRNSTSIFHHIMDVKHQVNLESEANFGSKVAVFLSVLHLFLDAEFCFSNDRQTLIVYDTPRRA